MNSLSKLTALQPWLVVPRAALGAGRHRCLGSQPQLRRRCWALGWKEEKRSVWGGKCQKWCRAAGYGVSSSLVGSDEVWVWFFFCCFNSFPWLNGTHGGRGAKTFPARGARGLGEPFWQPNFGVLVTEGFPSWVLKDFHPKPSTLPPLQAPTGRTGATGDPGEVAGG